MKSTFLIAVFFLNICYTTAMGNDPIKLPKENKVENTFSGDITESKSFHLIFTKHRKTKEFQVFSYLYDGVETTKIGLLNTKYAYSLISFHSNDDILTLLMSYDVKKKSFLKRIDINMNTNAISESDPFIHDDFKTVIRKKEKSIFIYIDKEQLLIKQFSGLDKIESKVIKISDGDSISRYFKDLNISSINTDEYVANGSTSKLRAYLINNNIVFTKENEEDNQTNVFKVSLDSSVDNRFQTSFINKGDKLKRSTSFVSGDKLYQLAVSKTKGYINIWDMNSKYELNHIFLSEELANNLKFNYVFIGMNNFLKQATKKTHIPTITVNKTTNEYVRVRLDYVDVAYNYGYNWWWHHQQFMWHMQMHQQHMMMNNVPNFGPSNDDNYFNSYEVNKDNRSFEVLIDSDGKISYDNLPETIYKDIDKEKYIDRLEEVKGLKHVSSCFLKNSFRYIAYSKSLKSFVIRTDKI